MATKMKYHQYVEDGKLYMACQNNCGNYEVVGEETVSTTCWGCVMKVVGVPKDKVSKPKSGRPAGWHFMKEFVDKDYPWATWCGDNGIHVGTHRFMSQDDIDRIKAALNY